MAESEWDVIIVGGGPGGYSAAIRCGQLGLKTLLIEKGELGGTCLNVGCIPTKSYVHFAELITKIRSANQIGVKAEINYIDLEKFQSNKQSIVHKLTNGIAHLLKNSGVKVEKGSASFLSPYQLKIKKGNKEKIAEAKNIIVAVGTSPINLNTLSFDYETIVSSSEVLSWTTLPKHIAIIGGGVIGLEFASIFSQLGVRVTVIEQLPQILAMEDEEIVSMLKRSLEKRGVVFYTSTKIKSHEKKVGKVSITLENVTSKFELMFDKVLVAAGRKPNIENLDLVNVPIKIDKGFILTNEYMETNVKGIYAVGDVTPMWPLAHVAYEEGLVAAENIAGKKTKMNYQATPRCIYTAPELSAVGLTELQAKQQYNHVTSQTISFNANSKALINGNGIGEGKLKIIFDETYGEIFGFSMVGNGVNELIAEGTLAMHLESTVEELTHVIHPHPSLSEGVKELALLAMGKPLHTSSLVSQWK
ncbi:dihydrolipoyl dehydrogenase [Alkalihalobacterium alkalinitrilicum]|uniref:dihydrolipoyl dehydrogenase n=1 Tax=Alkalihalobacterium alkalinitrilicum TaxID=427920 RepID=UPI000995D0EE|nr:dihydrolipoyl dehydrogenase [Alkalihalobacterium alkalinitrilicum]